MPRLIGIGGVFLYARDTERLADWYMRHLGFALERYAEGDQQPTFYQPLGHRDLDDPERKLYTVFAIMPAKHELGPVRNQAMINYAVDELDALVRQLNDAGIATEPVSLQDDGQGQGKFTHLSDPEGNRIELWEHLYT
jgi:predicted enzyme related to lactoylglutathione lyase